MQAFQSVWRAQGANNVQHRVPWRCGQIAQESDEPCARSIAIHSLCAAPCCIAVAPRRIVLRVRNGVLWGSSGARIILLHPMLHARTSFFSMFDFGAMACDVRWGYRCIPVACASFHMLCGHWQAHF